jgi:hypothetical protein
MKFPKYEKLPDPATLPGWYSTQEVMDIFLATRSAVSYWAATYKMRTRKVGTNQFLDAEDVRKFFDERNKLRKRKASGDPADSQPITPE